MKTKISILFLVLAGVFIYFVFKGGYLSRLSGDRPASRPVGQELRADDVYSYLSTAELRDYKGQALQLSEAELRAHPYLIVHLWASWCGPCVNEIPELMEFAEKNPNVKFVTVSLDETAEEISKFLKSFPKFDSPEYIRIWDNGGGISKLVDADRLPMSVIVRGENPVPQVIRSVVDWKYLEVK